MTQYFVSWKKFHCHTESVDTFHGSLLESSVDFVGIQTIWEIAFQRVMYLLSYLSIIAVDFPPWYLSLVATSKPLGVSSTTDKHLLQRTSMDYNGLAWIYNDFHRSQETNMDLQRAITDYNGLAWIYNALTRITTD